jgi:hypothetical protein
MRLREQGSPRISEFWRVNPTSRDRGARQPAVDRLVPPCGWDDGSSVPCKPIAINHSAERNALHRKLRPHPDGRASPVPAGRSNRAR